ncbi:MAG: ABC transporter ATP-binding protein [Candidatus Hermodarchaeota archaeon]
MATREKLLEVFDLKKYFPITEGIVRQKAIGYVHAVDGVNFHIYKGETLGLVGESGCGKTTCARMILKLTIPTEGDIQYQGKSILKMSRQELRPFRREIQIIFQDPYSSLNPRMTVYSIIGEALDIHDLAEKGKEKDEKILALLETVGLAPFHMYRYPHEFSGGQRQRIGIARALSVDPKLIVADEPVSALDVSIRAQILNLMQDLQEAFGLTFLFVAHDLSVIRHVCHRVAVMYVGKMVEVADVDAIYDDPQHPYTEALMSAVPIPDPTVKIQRIILEGDVPTPINPPSGCRFHPRCRYRQDICSKEEPPLRDLDEGTGSEHWVACHFPSRTRK